MVDVFHNLGLMYANGEGVEKNNIYAAVLWTKASSHGHAGAENNLEQITSILSRQDNSKVSKISDNCSESGEDWCWE